MKQSLGVSTSDARTDSSVINRFASAVSIVCSPPVLALPLGIITAQRAPAEANVAPGLVTIIVATGLLPALFVGIGYHLGSIRDLNVSDRQQRRAPSLFAALCALAAQPILMMQGSATILVSLASVLACQLAMLAVLTNWWRVSYHTACIGGLAMVALALQGPSIGLPLVFLAGIVAWSRLRLGCHTRAEAAMGLASALPLAFWPWPV